VQNFVQFILDHPVNSGQYFEVGMLLKQIFRIKFFPLVLINSNFFSNLYQRENVINVW